MTLEQRAAAVETIADNLPNEPVGVSAALREVADALREIEAQMASMREDRASLQAQLDALSKRLSVVELGRPVAILQAHPSFPR